jgi:hypothetical protein
MEIIFKGEHWNNLLKVINFGVSKNTNLFTGFPDSEGKDIFDGDILTRQFEVDGVLKSSELPVFWSKEMGAWAVDMSFKKDGGYPVLLSKELKLEKYKILETEKA